MIKNVTIGTMTMNAGMDIPGSTLRWAIRNQFQEFAKVVVVDGNLTQEASDFYSQFENVVVIPNEWRDNYQAQYEVFYNTLNDGEWAIWLDDDEILSEELLDFFRKAECGTHLYGVDIWRIPCVLHLTEDGKHYFPQEKEPEPSYNGQWTKNILFNKGNIKFAAAGSHVVPQTSGEYGYLPYPYLHMKTLESFCYNDTLQAFLLPEAQQYSIIDARLFKMFTQCYKSTKEFNAAMKKGTWPPPLKKFAWDRRREVSNPVSRLAWAYYILEGHPMPEVDDFMEWENVKQYILDLRLYEENKKKGNSIILER